MKKLEILVCAVLVLVGAAVSPSAAEIVGWWKFEQTADDSSGYGHNGTVSGSTSWVEGFVDDYAINLTGGYVLINDSSALRPPRFTVTVWVKLPSAQPAYARVLEKGYDNHETYNFQGGGYGMHFMVRDNGGGTHGCGIKGEIPANEWAFLAGVYDGSNIKIFLNGELENTDPAGSFTPYNSSGEPLCIGGRPKPDGVDRLLNGMVDDVRVYNTGVSDTEVKEMFAWVGGDTSVAALPQPKHQAINVSPYTVLSWFPGKGSTSHDVYLGLDETAVENATTTSAEYKDNVTDPNYDPPGLLELGATYFWRIDENSDSGTAKGDVWQFTVDDGKASQPNPPDGLANTPADAVLSWTAGNYATSHDVYFGTDEAAVADATTDSPEYRGNQVETSYSPGTLQEGITYRWRVDEVGDDDTFAKGHVWKFVTVGALHLQVDLALPRCSEAGIFTDPPVAGTLKEGWWPWVAARWYDMYMHDAVWERGENGEGPPPDTDGIAGSGVHVAIGCGGVGNGGFHIKGLCRCGLAGDCCPTGEAQGDPIANGWYHNVDWGGEATGDILMRINGLPPGKYMLISYHNHWEPASQATRNCLDSYSGMPNMPVVKATSLPVAGLPEYGGKWNFTPGTGMGVTSILEAYDVDVTSVYSDDEVSTSLVKFHTDGNDVLVIYDGGDNTYPDPARPGREGSKGILNAFELILYEPDPCKCLGDLAGTDGFSAPDGKIDTGDMAKLLSELILGGGTADDNYKVQSPSRYLRSCGDLAGTDGFSAPDGKIDTGDMAKLLSHLITNGDPDNNYECACVELP